MTSPLLALFLRSVREDTRAKSTCWARAGLAAFMLAVMVIAAVSQSSGGAPGLVFLKSAAWLQAVFLTISGLGYFGSAIAEEKEDGTLGLLRMTNLSPLSILLGKSTSRLGGALLLLAAQLPFTFMAVTLGGVAPRQVLAAYCTLGAYTFLLCNLALLASVLAARTVTAAALAGGVLGAFILGAQFVPALAAASPFHRLGSIFQTGFAGRIAGFQVASNLAAGVVFFLLAWLFFRAFCETSSEAASTAATTRRWWRLGWCAPGRPEAGRALQWKDYHFLHGGKFLTAVQWSACAAAVALTAATAMLAENSSSSMQFSPVIFAAAILGVLFEIGFMASRICAVEVRDQTLASLAILPQDLPRTFRQKVDACWHALAPLGALLLLSVFISEIAAFAGRGHFPDAILLSGLFMGMAVAYFTPMAYLGACLTLYLSLRMKRGALPLAIVLCLGLNVFAIIPCFGWFAVPIAAFFIGRNLSRKSLLRLEDLASEG